jgi:hypothetical protein
MDDQATVIAAYVLSPPKFDAIEGWENAPAVQIQHLWSGEPAPPERHATVRLCWSPSGLHVRFLCEQREPLIVADWPVLDKKTLGLWDRDVCEVFLAPDANNPSTYYEFEAAPTGEWVDLAINLTPLGRQTEWDYASGMKAFAGVASDFTLTGITIPWSTRIPRPAAGEIWKVNLFRCVGPHPTERYLAWRPTRTPEPNFHVPDAFGWLKFEE